MTDKQPKPFPAFYALLWPWIVAEAREHGYCAALHGSMARDLDVIAVAWTENASDPETLVRGIMTRTNAHLLCEKHPQLADHEDYIYPKRKPHGRLCWSLHMDDGYIDLSVIPPLKA